MKLAREGLTIDSVFGSTAIGAAPVAMELFDDINVIIQRTAGQFRSFSVDVHAPAISGIDQALCVFRNVLPSQRFLRQSCTSAGGFCGDVDRWLTDSVCQRKFFVPLLWTWRKEKVEFINGITGKWWCVVWNYLNCRCCDRKLYLNQWSRTSRTFHLIHHSHFCALLTFTSVRGMNIDVVCCLLSIGKSTGW